MPDRERNTGSSGLTISAGPNDVRIIGTPDKLAMLRRALEKAEREGTATIEQDGRVLVAIFRERNWRPR